MEYRLHMECEGLESAAPGEMAEAGYARAEPDRCLPNFLNSLA